MQNDYLDFEHELQAIDLAISDCTDQPKLAQLSKQRAAILAQLYKKLDAWQIVQMARHPDRPHAKDFIDTITTNQVFFSGDRITGRCLQPSPVLRKLRTNQLSLLAKIKVAPSKNACNTNTECQIHVDIVWHCALSNWLSATITLS